MDTNKEYYLCSKAVVDHFKPEEISKAFRSGYDFDKNIEYYVACFDFEEVDKYYREVILPFNEKSRVEDIDFWCRQCHEGSMDVSKVTIAGSKRIGLLAEIETKIGLTNMNNIAMVIFNLSKKFGCSPIEFINRIAKK